MKLIDYRVYTYTPHDLSPRQAHQSIHSRHPHTTNLTLQFNITDVSSGNAVTVSIIG
jgi:hypothetical protein